MKIGIDIEENKRFDNLSVEENEKFLKRLFSERELEYCFSKKKYSQHLCARFCAKEALVKALSDKTLEFNKIEVLNDEKGRPYFVDIPKYEDFNVELSLSHCDEYSCANVLVYKK